MSNGTIGMRKGSTLRAKDLTCGRLGAAFMKARARAGLTLAEMAHAMDRSINTIRWHEAGTRPMRADELVRAATIMQCPVGDLYRTDIEPLTGLELEAHRAANRLTDLQVDLFRHASQAAGSHVWQLTGVIERMTILALLRRKLIGKWQRGESGMVTIPLSDLGDMVRLSVLRKDVANAEA